MDREDANPLLGRRALLVGADSALARALQAIVRERETGLTLVGASADEGAPAHALLHAEIGRAGALLDEALDEVARVEASVAQAKALGAPLLLVSSLEVHGEREGSLFEADPLRTPFPRAATSGARGWDTAAELAAARRLVEEGYARGQHADVASRAVAEAKAALEANKEPTRGRALAAVAEAEQRAFLERVLNDVGQERARGWGFRTVRGYTCALAEQLVAESGVPYAIVRVPALSAPLRLELERPFDDGKAPLAAWAALARGGVVTAPGPDDAVLDLLPLDLAAEAVLLTLEALLGGAAPAVVHASLAAGAALTLGRASDLVDLYARRSSAGRSSSSSAPSSSWRRALERLAKAAVELPAPRRASLEPGVLVWSPNQRLRGRALADLERRRGQRVLDPAFDWRRYLLDRHLPAALAHHERATTEAVRPLHAYDSLLALLEEGAARYRSQPALSRFAGAERHDVSYAELHARARAVARRLDEAGVSAGDRVLLSGANHPSWAVACFGILAQGAVCVPLDPALSPEQAANIARKAAAKIAILDDKARKAFGAALDEPTWDLALATVSGPPGGRRADEIAPDDTATILFTSGTTGDPKGVMLTHANFTSLIASLARVFDVHGDDRLLSVLPLHHTFELTCGLLLPLMAGGQVFYLDEINGERLLFALREGRVTAMVGVPALWQLLERRLKKQIEERGPLLRSFFDASLSLNQTLAERLGHDVGRVLFRPIHQELGGHLRTLISGGAALPAEVHRLFHGLGLPIAEGYGLTEAAPVLTVAEPIPGAPAGTVGRAVPGVELQIKDPDDKGTGEVLARGPNVMKGYFRDERATSGVLDEEGWLHTGDLGFLDESGRLTLVGRAKDVVVTAAGENVYLDDVEARIGEVAGVGELSLVGLPDARGGERLALVYVASEGVEPKVARERLEAQLLKLPTVFRPAVVRPWPFGELPRTATLKVKRKDVRARLEELLAAEPAEADGEERAPAFAAVRGALAHVAGVDVGTLRAGTEIAAELGFDSLMWVELQGALEPIVGALDAEALYACRTVAELEAFVRKQARSGPSARKAAKPDDGDGSAPVRLPSFVRRPARGALAHLQRELYRTLYATDVEGRANIPHNRSCIVVANHTSHLDTGLVKFALGRYGDALTPLAARDYFFAGHPLKVAFFENLTNLRPIDRETGSGRSFEQAVDAVREGNVVLIFPEGTRREDGTLGAFKPLVGRLSLKTKVDVLPLYLDGAYDAFPKGASVPRPGKLAVRIGPPLEARELERLTAHLPPVQAARAATALIRQAVVALQEGSALELAGIARVDDEGNIEASPPPAARASRRSP